MKLDQRGDAGVTMLVVMVVLMSVWFWHGGGGHGGGRGHMSEAPSTVTHKETALDLLDAAYARGDIAREDYLQRRDDLLKR
jgi:uncharacterized membrane protein